MWIEKRIVMETFEPEDLAQLVTWIKALAKKVEKRG